MNILYITLIMNLIVCGTGRFVRKCCASNQILDAYGECIFDDLLLEKPKDDSDIEFSIEPFNEQNRTKCGYWNSLILNWNVTDKYTITKNGTLTLYASSTGSKVTKVAFEPDEFCSDLLSSSRRRVIKICACEKLICLRKCCAAGHVYNFSSGPRCIRSNDTTWNLQLITDDDPENADLAYFVLEDRMPKCKGFHNFASTAFIPPELLNDFWWKYPSGRAFHGRQLCKDTINGGHSEISIICEDVTTWNVVLKPLWHVPAAVLLALTLATMLVCSELRVGTHGRALFCHVIALLIVNVILAINVKHTFFGIRHDVYVVLRKGSDVLVHYGVWASAFWLNSICINIGLGFRTNATMRCTARERRNFMWFSLYSWITPAVITTVVVVLRILPSAQVPFLYKPTMIETRSGHYELEGLLKFTSFAYYFAPMTILLIINLVMFVFTTSKVVELQSASKMLTKQTSSLSNVGSGKKTKRKISVVDAQTSGQTKSIVTSTKSMLLYVRLLCTMGVLEMVVEIATWATYNYAWYEATMDAVDLLRAVCVFALACCKRRVLDNVRSTTRGLRCLLTPGRRRAREELEMESVRTSTTSPPGRNSKSTSGSSTARGRGGL